MSDALHVLLRLSVPVFVVSTMLAMGLGLAPQSVIAPLRNPRLVAITLLVNFVIAPTLAYVLTTVVPLERPYAVGLLLLSVAAGAPFLPKLIEFARGDLATSIALMSLLTGGTILFMPVAVPLLVPEFEADAWGIARPQLVLVLLPLVLAMLVRHWAPGLAGRCCTALNTVSTASLLLLLLLLIGGNLNAMIGVIGSGAIAVAAVFVALMFTAGYALGGGSGDQRGVLGLAAATRNAPAALAAAAGQNDPKVIVMLLVGTLMALLLSLPAAARLRRSALRDRPVLHPVLSADAAGAGGCRPEPAADDAISSSRR